MDATSARRAPNRSCATFSARSVSSRDGQQAWVAERRRESAAGAGDAGVAAPQLLLLDEPTPPGPDHARALSMALNEFEGTVMLVSPRPRCCARCATSLLVATRVSLRWRSGRYQKWLLDTSREMARARAAAARQAVPVPQPAALHRWPPLHRTTATKQEPQGLVARAAKLSDQTRPMRNEATRLEARVAALGRRAPAPWRRRWPGPGWRRRAWPSWASA